MESIRYLFFLGFDGELSSIYYGAIRTSTKNLSDLSNHWAFQRTLEVIRLVTENSKHIIDVQLLVGLVAGTVGHVLHYIKKKKNRHDNYLP